MKNVIIYNQERAMILQLCSFCHPNKYLIAFLKCGGMLWTMLADKNSDNILEKAEYLLKHPSRANLIYVNTVYHS